MKKKERIITYSILTIAATTMLWTYNKYNKKEKNESAETTEGITTEASEMPSETTTAEIITEFEMDNIIESEGLRYEIIECDVYDSTELYEQDKYSLDYFANEDAKKAYLEDNYMDSEKMYADYPELEELLNNPDESEEYAKKLEPYSDIFQQYIHPIEREQHFIFIKCKVKNISEISEEKELRLWIYKQVIYNEFGQIRPEGIYPISYFDNLTNDKGEEPHCAFYYTYPFEKDEQIECIIGFTVIEDNNTYALNADYIGAYTEEVIDSFSEIDYAYVEYLRKKKD